MEGSPLTPLPATGPQLLAHPVVVVTGAAALVSAALAVVAVEHGQLRGDDMSLARFTIVAGVSFICAGLLASSRRPERWTGSLMIAAGFALFAGTLIDMDRSLPFTLGLMSLGIPTALLVHLVLVFPDGRLHSAWERLVVGVAYATAIVVQAAMLTYMDVGHVGGCPCPENLLFAHDDVTTHMRLMSALRYLGIAVAAAVLVALAARWRTASPLMRRALFPIVVVGGLAVALRAATLLASSLPYAGAPYTLQSAQHLVFGVVPIAYLVGQWRAQMGRAEASDLIVELGRGLELGQLRDAIARALHDPSLELGFWIRDPDEYVDVDGHPISVAPAAGRGVTILERHGRKVAALVHDSALSENPALLDAVSSAAGLALENERLLAESRARLDEVRDSRARIVEASVAERRRLERNLHDGAQQRLVTLSLRLRMAQETLRDDPDAAEEMLEGVGEDLMQALNELRELARGLHPAVLSDRGLAPALQSLVNRSPFPVALGGVPDVRLPEPVEAALYYVVAESLTNAAKHAGATAGRVELSTTPGTVVVEIGDDGSGGASLHGGTGLVGLRDRVEALGGGLQVESAPGRGTVIRAELPLR
jgi:signal transduction histidine kinase